MLTCVTSEIVTHTATTSRSRVSGMKVQSCCMKSTPPVIGRSWSNLNRYGRCSHELNAKLPS